MICCKYEEYFTFHYWEDLRNNFIRKYPRVQHSGRVLISIDVASRQEQQSYHSISKNLAGKNRFKILLQSQGGVLLFTPHWIFSMLATVLVSSNTGSTPFPFGYFPLVPTVIWLPDSFKSWELLLPYPHSIFNFRADQFPEIDKIPNQEIGSRCHQCQSEVLRGPQSGTLRPTHPRILYKSLISSSDILC